MRFNFSVQTLSRLALFLVVGATLVGCEEDPNPFIGEDKPYTLYGFMNPRVERQYVRVISVEGTINDIGIGAESAEVTSIDLETGEQRIWKDSLITFENGRTGVVFYSDFSPAYERDYRLEVKRKDGATSSVEVTVPRDINIVKQDDPNQNPFIPEFFLEGEIPNLLRVDVKYDSYALQPQKPVTLDPIPYPVDVSYLGEEIALPGGWLFRVDLRKDRNILRETFNDVCLNADFISVIRMNLEFFVVDDAWVPPGGVFDPEVLVQPELFSNVENGFGYVGAGYPVSFNIFPTSSIIEQLGYTYTPPCREMTPLSDPSCTIKPGCFE